MKKLLMFLPVVGLLMACDRQDSGGAGYTTEGDRYGTNAVPATNDVIAPRAPSPEAPPAPPPTDPTVP